MESRREVFTSNEDSGRRDTAVGKRAVAGVVGLMVVLNFRGLCIFSVIVMR